MPFKTVPFGAEEGFLCVVVADGVGAGVVDSNGSLPCQLTRVPTCLEFLSFSYLMQHYGG